jgi:hypothetical protein
MHADTHGTRPARGVCATRRVPPGNCERGERGGLKLKVGAGRCAARLRAPAGEAVRLAAGARRGVAWPKQNRGRRATSRGWRRRSKIRCSVSKAAGGRLEGRRMRLVRGATHAQLATEEPTTKQQQQQPPQKAGGRKNARGPAKKGPSRATKLGMGMGCAGGAAGRAPRRPGAAWAYWRGASSGAQRRRRGGARMGGRLGCGAAPRISRWAPLPVGRGAATNGVWDAGASRREGAARGSRPALRAAGGVQ